MSELLDAIHETAKGLYDARLMNATTMHEFEALCLPPVKELAPQQIKSLRLRCKASQAVFAVFKGSSLKLLNLVKDKGLGILA